MCFELIARVAKAGIASENRMWNCGLSGHKKTKSGCDAGAPTTSATVYLFLLRQRDFAPRSSADKLSFCRALSVFLERNVRANAAMIGLGWVIQGRIDTD